MIVIITGASHTGKTVLAQRMLEKYKYPYLSIDHLKMGLIRSGNTDLTPEDDDELEGYLWPIVREMIKTAIENKQNLIVEGCYIPYDWRRDFTDEYLSEIKFICLAMTNEYIDAHFSDIKGHGSDIENRLDDSDCTHDGPPFFGYVSRPALCACACCSFLGISYSFPSFISFAPV